MHQQKRTPTTQKNAITPKKNKKLKQANNKHK